jgi:hypothetical protein
MSRTSDVRLRREERALRPSANEGLGRSDNEGLGRSDNEGLGE